MEGKVHVPLVLGRFHHDRMRLPVSSALCPSQSSIAHIFAYYVLWQGTCFTVDPFEFILTTFLSPDLSDCLCLYKFWLNQKISWHLCNWKIGCGNSCREIFSICKSSAFATLLAHMGFCCLHSHPCKMVSQWQFQGTGSCVLPTCSFLLQSSEPSIVELLFWGRSAKHVSTD